MGLRLKLRAIAKSMKPSILECDDVLPTPECRREPVRGDVFAVPQEQMIVVRRPVHRMEGRWPIAAGDNVSCREALSPSRASSGIVKKIERQDRKMAQYGDVLALSASDLGCVFAALGRHMKPGVIPVRGGFNCE